MMGCTSNQEIMISQRNISGYYTHKSELQAFLEDNETFTKEGYNYNMSHNTAVTRNREDRKGGGTVILLRQDLASTVIDDIQLTKTTVNDQLMVVSSTTHTDIYKRLWQGRCQ